MRHNHDETFFGCQTIDLLPCQNFPVFQSGSSMERPNSFILFASNSKVANPGELTEAIHFVIKLPNYFE
jgi:hypothetical protein